MKYKTFQNSRVETQDKITYSVEVVVEVDVGSVLDKKRIESAVSAFVKAIKNDR